MMPRQVGKLDKSSIFLLALAAIPVAWLALLAAPLLGAEQTLPGLLEGLNAALSQPWRIQWCEQSPKCLLLALGLYGVGVLAWATSRRRTKPLEEYGSARWGEAAAVNRRYAAARPAENLILTEHVRPRFGWARPPAQPQRAGCRRLRRGQDPLLRQAQRVAGQYILHHHRPQGGDMPRHRQPDETPRLRCKSTRPDRHEPFFRL